MSRRGWSKPFLWVLDIFILLIYGRNFVTTAVSTLQCIDSQESIPQPLRCSSWRRAGSRLLAKTLRPIIRRRLGLDYPLSVFVCGLGGGLAILLQQFSHFGSTECGGNPINSDFNTRSETLSLKHILSPEFSGAFGDCSI